MGGKSSPSGSTTSTQNTSPWGPQQPYLTDIFSRAQGLYNNNTPQYFPGSTYAGPTDAQQKALADTASYASIDPSAKMAQSASNSFLNGTFLSSNPALAAFEQLTAAPNIGTNNLGTQTLVNQATSLSNPALGYLGFFANNNPASGAPGTQGLLQTGSANPALGPGNAVLGAVANGGNTNAGTNTLASLAGSNPGVGVPGSTVLNALSSSNQGWNNPASQILAGLSANNIGATAPGNGVLWGLSANNVGANNAGSNVLGKLAGANLAGANPANSAFNRYASGASLAQGNPNTSDVAQSVLAQVVPSIQSQFIQGGALSSPEAARATAAGATSALAPLLFNQYQQEEQNQLAGAQGLSNSFLQGVGLQGSLAQNLAGNVLQGAGLQGSAAQNLASNTLTGGALQGSLAQNLAGNYLQGAGLQGTTAQNLANNALTGTGLQGSFANSLASQLLAGTGLQSSAAQALNSSYLGQQGLGLQANSNLLNSYLTGNQQQLGAASALGNQALQGAGIQQGAASNLGSQALQGLGLQQQAASGEQNAWGQGMQNIIQALGLAPQTQAMPYTDLSQLYSAGATQQGLSQQAINDAVQRWNYGQSLPFNALNQYIGQVTGNYGGTTQLNQPFFAPSTGQQVLGGLSQIPAAIGGLGTLFGLFSDRRAKTDIVRIATLKNGLPVYVFRYIGQPGLQIGLMADEVERVHPEAVFTLPNGMKVVEYTQAVT